MGIRRKDWSVTFPRSTTLIILYFKMRSVSFIKGVMNDHTYEKQEESLKWTFSNDFIWTKRLSVIFIFPLFVIFPMNVKYIYG